MTTQTQPQTMHDIYTFYLSPAHVTGHARTVTIEKATIQGIFSTHANKELPALVLHFSNARRSLKLNKTQAEQMWDLTGTDDHTKWAGVKIHLDTAKTRNGKMTITISKPQEQESY